ncbi:MAG: YoaK family protein [Phycisphaerales bacterium]
MLSARAYSFRQKSRLAISLSWIGGYTNVVASLACGSLVSHVTGSATNIGHFVVAGDLRHAALFIFLVVAFFIGTIISAFLTETARRRGNRSKYVMPIAVELLLLIIFGLGYEAHRSANIAPSFHWQYALVGLASMAMGIQNATITKISGAVVRTTHLTGVVTDLGLEGVQFLFWWMENIRDRWASRAGRLFKVSQRHPSALRLLLLASIFGSFLFGAAVGTLMFLWHPPAVMAPVILFLTWIIVADVLSPIADVRELDLLSDPELKAHGILKAMLPLEIGIYRSACLHRNRAHRSPNFQLWVDGLPKHQKVVILAVSPTMRFDANAVMDLELAVKKLHDHGRKLIISGITVAQCKSLDKWGVERMMDVSNLCPDMEFAIARAFAILQHLPDTARPRYHAPTPAISPVPAPVFAFASSSPLTKGTTS